MTISRKRNHDILHYFRFFRTSKSKKLNDLEKYIKQFPDGIQQRLLQLCALIREIEPEASESLSYGMPAFKLNGKPLVYVAGYTKHIGLYALPFTHAAFKEDLQSYKQGKGSVQFPHSEELPLALIAKMVKWRASEVRQLT